MFSSEQGSREKKLKPLTITIGKRQKFITAVLVLSLALFISEYQFGNSGLVISLIISLLTDIFIYWAIRRDLSDSYTYTIFILPFFYSLSFGLFYFLVPARLISRIILTTLYAFGFYSLCLSENIFVVSSIRTIALLSGARIVSFVVTLISYVFLTDAIFSTHLFILPIILIFSLFSYLLIYQSLWTYNLQKSTYSLSMWSGAITFCLAQLAVALWFWPSSPTIIALFLTGFFYIFVGLSHVWFEKRLFKSVLIEYTWVGLLIFSILLLFTSWGK